MTRPITSTLALLSLVLGTLGAQAQEGNAGRGERLVRSECVRCHAVEPRAASPDPDAPNLASVARMPSATDLSLRVFLSSPHRNMPNLVLTAEEVADVIAYIRTLDR